MIGCTFLQCSKNLLMSGFRTSLTFRKFKVVLNPLQRALISFAKSRKGHQVAKLNYKWRTNSAYGTRSNKPNCSPKRKNSQRHFEPLTERIFAYEFVQCIMGWGFCMIRFLSFAIVINFATFTSILFTQFDELRKINCHHKYLHLLNIYKKYC